MSIIIIAEAGVNHNGSLALAKKMALIAKEAGADIVKYQTAVPELVISQFAPKAEYQKDTTGAEENQLEMVKKIHFGFDEHRELKEYCDEIGIMYLSAPFDLASVDFLESIDMPMWKIPSGELTNLPMLEKIAKTKKKVILSTGMSTIEEIKLAVKILEDNGASEVITLHCNTEYPTPLADANILAMVDIKEKVGTKVGFSDHTLGLCAPLAAAALGAVVIEKHFTLDKTMEGPDHLASMNPEELHALVKEVRMCETALGDKTKKVTKSEEKNIAIARKSIVAKINIKKGEILTEDNITVKRPGNGISPMKWYDVLGTKASRDFIEDELIEL